MRLIRFQDPAGNIHFGSQQPDGSALLLDGDPFNGLKETGHQADVTKLLAPIAPTQILCVGLNYRRHAEETKAKIPERPILFVKASTPSSTRATPF